MQAIYLFDAIWWTKSCPEFRGPIRKLADGQLTCLADRSIYSGLWHMCSKKVGTDGDMMRDDHRAKKPLRRLLYALPWPSEGQHAGAALPNDATKVRATQPPPNHSDSTACLVW
jgi:hypothetical protein